MPDDKARVPLLNQIPRVSVAVEGRNAVGALPSMESTARGRVQIEPVVGVKRPPSSSGMLPIDEGHDTIPRMPTSVRNAAQCASMKMYFSDFFSVQKRTLNKYGAFDISLLADLPLFVDPFLLFNSKRAQYRALHDRMIDYLRFLKEKSTDAGLSQALRDSWYRFPEVRQNWFGFTLTGNSGRGLGRVFANALHLNLWKIFGTFGAEGVTRASHLEKLCLIREGVGRDNISDFTNNLIKEFLLEYTQRFAIRHIDSAMRRTVTVRKVRFNYGTETWEAGSFDLPWYLGDYVLLTPKDILTRDDTWINKADLIGDFETLPEAVPDAELRAQINNYFYRVLPKKATRKDRNGAAFSTIQRFPELIDYYIRKKEDGGDKAESIAKERVAFSERLYLERFRELANLLQSHSPFYQTEGTTYTDAYQRVLYFKDVIENKGGHRIFYVGARPLEREEDVQILYRMTWFAAASDVTREANDGRGPVDFKVSKGSADKTLVEFKLAKNTQLERNLAKQVPIYEKASGTKVTIKVIVYFNAAEKNRVGGILERLKLSDDKNVIWWTREKTTSRQAPEPSCRFGMH